MFCPLTYGPPPPVTRVPRCVGERETACCANNNCTQNRTQCALNENVFRSINVVGQRRAQYARASPPSPLRGNWKPSHPYEAACRNVGEEIQHHRNAPPKFWLVLNGIWRNLENSPIIHQQMAFSMYLPSNTSKSRWKAQKLPELVHRAAVLVCCPTGHAHRTQRELEVTLRPISLLRLSLLRLLDSNFPGNSLWT